jgi:membrane protease YdiL (CAAX protease family)
MSIPRLSAFGVLLVLNRRWNIAAFSMPLSGCSRAARMGFVPFALWLYFFNAGHGQSFTNMMMVVGLFTSLVVGLFEEYAFRGPLLSALSDRFSLFTTVVLSNILFAVYHIQAQPIRFWLIIFLTGVIYANLRLRGLSLGWIALIHGVTDASFFLFPSINPEPFGFYGLVLQIGLLIYAVMTFPRSNVTGSRWHLTSGLRCRFSFVSQGPRRR